MLSDEEGTSPTNQPLEDSLVTLVPDVGMGSADKAIVQEVANYVEVVEVPQKSVSACHMAVKRLVTDIYTIMRVMCLCYR